VVSAAADQGDADHNFLSGRCIEIGGVFSGTNFKPTSGSTELAPMGRLFGE
jgi:hypothetical protein